jgi:hypothetical protein
MEKFHNKQTLEAPSVNLENILQSTLGSINARDQATCDFLNRGLNSNLFSLVACYHKMRIPIRYLTPIEGGWIECVIADDTQETEDDARVVLKNYTIFTLVFGKETRALL